MQPDPEAAVATSLDGRRFGFEAPLRGHVFEPGGYVAIGGDGGALGQVHEFAVARRDGVRFAAGEGAILDGGGEAFTDAPVLPARPERVAAWLEHARPPRASARVRRARARAGRAARARRRRLRPAHVPVRAVRLGQDVRARRRAGAAAGGDRAAARHPRPELRPRAPRRGARRRRPRARGALSRRRRRASASARPTGRARAACACASPACRRGSRRRCCGSTPSPTATSTA